jgi:hypothetical protein
MTNKEFAEKWAGKQLDFRDGNLTGKGLVVGYYSGGDTIVVAWNGGLALSGYTAATFVAPTDPRLRYWALMLKFFILPTDDKDTTKPVKVSAVSKSANHYPHLCPRNGCGKPAYLRMSGGVDCSSQVCNHYSNDRL